MDSSDNRRLAHEIVHFLVPQPARGWGRDSMKYRFKRSRYRLTPRLQLGLFCECSNMMVLSCPVHGYDGL